MAKSRQDVIKELLYEMTKLDVEERTYYKEKLIQGVIKRLRFILRRQAMPGPLTLRQLAYINDEQSEPSEFMRMIDVYNFGRIDGIKDERARRKAAARKAAARKVSTQPTATREERTAQLIRILEEYGIIEAAKA